jgi:excisionase family DNA binding protein
MTLEEQIEQIAETVCRRLVAEAEKVTPIDQMPPQKSEPLVGARMAAAHLSISERQLRAMVSNQSVPFYRVGGSVRFKLSELESHARVSERRLRAV